jgi:hypothetical protein
MLEIKKNGCSLRIFTEDGKVFPQVSGKVPKKLEKRISEVRGMKMSQEAAMNLLKNLF